MRNVLPLAFTRTRGSFFNVAALARPRPTDRLTTVGLPPFTFLRFRCCEVLRRAISKIKPFDGVPSNSRIRYHIPPPNASRNLPTRSARVQIAGRWQTPRQSSANLFWYVTGQTLPPIVGPTPSMGICKNDNIVFTFVKVDCVWKHKRE